MNISDKYTGALASEQAKLISYVKQMTAKIDIPESAVTTTTKEPAKHTAVSAACLVGGALALIAGLCMEKTGVSAAGGIAVAGGVALMAMDRNRTGQSQREVSFYKVTSHYYKSLSDIYKYVSKTWTETLVGLKSELKADIMQLDISDDKKNEAIQSVLTTSVVDMSMSDLSKKLGEIERAKDENGYKQYVAVFEQKCIAAINKAFDEQKSVYEGLQV